MTRKLFVSITVLASVAALGSFACDKTGAEAQEKANKAQAEANKDIANANAEADGKMRAAQAEADKKIAEAKGDFAKTREDYRHTVQTNLDELDKKIAVLEAKAKKETGKAKMDLDANIAALKTRREGFATSVRSLDNATATSWDATKARLDKEWADLKAAVDRAT